MIILFVGVLLIIYAIAAKKYSVAWGMLFVLIIMGCQEGIPGDFMGYKDTYNEGGAEAGYLGSTVKEAEYSFIWLTQFCSRFMSFHWFVFFTSLVQCLVMGAMIKKYADNRYWSFGVLLVFFTYNIMLLQMKAMRQGYAVESLLLAYWLIGERRFLLALIMAAICYGFHNSSLVALPFFLVFLIIMFLKRKEVNNADTEDVCNVAKDSYPFAIVVAVGLIAFTILKFSVIDDYLKPLVNTWDFFEYGAYLEEMQDKRLAWWIVLYVTVSVFAVSLYYKNEANIYKKYLAFLSIIASYVYVGIFGMGSLFRVSMYFDIFAIVTFPNVAGMLRNTYGKDVASLYVIFNMVYLMYFSVAHMTSMSIIGGFGYGMYKFSFMNW